MPDGLTVTRKEFAALDKDHAVFKGETETKLAHIEETMGHVQENTTRLFDKTDKMNGKLNWILGAVAAAGALFGFVQWLLEYFTKG